MIRHGVMGGYSPVPDFKTNLNVVEAAAFAYQKLQSSPHHLKLSEQHVADFEIVGASQQVVAGLNFRLNLAFRDSLGGIVGSGATVVVYNHFGNLSVTSMSLN